MGAERVHIGELKLRVPGISAPAARELGKQVASEIAAALQPGTRLPKSGAVRIRVTVPAGISTEQMSAGIAHAILRSLR